MFELLEKLIKTPGVAGYEEPIRERIREEIEDYGEVVEDNIGNLILTLGEGKHVSLIAHMDELGLVVTKIEENGILRIRKVGGIDDRSLVGRVVEISTRKGTVNGVIGLKAPHLMMDPEEQKKVITFDRLCVDVGTRSMKETEALGIRVLDTMVFTKQVIVMNKKMLAARGLDNRIGCFVLIKVLEAVQKRKLKARYSFVWSVQEELGLRGAVVVSNTLKPDVVFAVDTYSTADTPDVVSHYMPIALGKGPVLRMLDSRAVASPRLRDFVIAIARKNRIPLQIGVTGGSTDGAAVQECGALMLPIGVPLRYTHSPTECAHMDDIKNIIKLLTKIVETFK